MPPSLPSAQPPLGQAFNRQAELAVVGSILLDNGALLHALSVLKASDFGDANISTIFKACCELSDEGTAIDLVTLANQLLKHGKENWIATLIECGDVTPTAVNVIHYAEIVKRYSIARTIKHTAVDINQGMSKVIADGADMPQAREVLSSVGRMIMEAENELTLTGPKQIGESANDTLKFIDEAAKTPDGVTGIGTTIPTLNILTGGMHGSQLTLVGARPAVGKSALALDFALHAARKGTPTLFRSLEMSHQDITIRAICQDAKVDIMKARRGHIHKDEWGPLREATERLNELPLYIDDNANATFSEVRAQAHLYKRQYDIGILFIDYLQLLHGSEEARARSREQEIGEISRGMKNLSKELDIPVVCLVQLNREVDKRPDKRPMLSDLRESGSLEQDADNILFLYRQEQKDTPWTGDTGLILAKQRNGPEGEVDLTLEREYATFKERLGGLHY